MINLPFLIIIFHDFPGLENEILKFHDFPGFPWTGTNPVKWLVELVTFFMIMMQKKTIKSKSLKSMHAALSSKENLCEQRKSQLILALLPYGWVTF